MKRPAAVTIVAAFLFVASVISWVVGIAVLVPTPFSEWMWSLNPAARPAFESLHRVPGAMLVALGCATLAGAFGLLRGKKWAWWFAIVLFIVNGGGDLVALFVIHDWVRSGAGVLAAAVFLITLMNLRVREFCVG